VELPRGAKQTLNPFFGVMGVAPPLNWSRITSIISRAHGGYMDNKELVAGQRRSILFSAKGLYFRSAMGMACRAMARSASRQ
jgi:hypothetical protein